MSTVAAAIPTGTSSSECCSLCSHSKYADKVTYKCGTILSKYFPISETNPTPGWYKGTVAMHYLSRNNDEECIWNKILYDDGDIENLPQEEMQHYQIEVWNASVTPDSTTSIPTTSAHSPKPQWLFRRESHPERSGAARLKPIHPQPDKHSSSQHKKGSSSQGNKDNAATPDAPGSSQVGENKVNAATVTPNAPGSSQMGDNKDSPARSITQEQRWQNKLEQLKEFKAENGHTRVPRDHTDPSLVQWVQNQRRLYKRGIPPKLPPERIRQLNEIGFDLNLPGNDQKWESMLDQLKKFKAETGHIQVPKAYKDRSLYNWLKQQRKYYKRENPPMPMYRKEKLQEIGIESPSFLLYQPKAIEARWERMLDQLRKFKDVTGHIRVPKSYEDQSLFNWLKKQRKNYKRENPPMPVYRKKKLQEIGIENKSPLPPNQGLPKLSKSKLYDTKWERNLEQLKEFKAETGHFKVPIDYKNPALHCWVKNQQTLYKREHPPMPANRIQKLQEIGVDWGLPGQKKWGCSDPRRNYENFAKKPGSDIWDQKWQYMLAKLKNFKAANGHCQVPSIYNEDPALGNWVVVQRGRYKQKNSSMPAERIRLLNEIGFVWAIKGNDDGLAEPTPGTRYLKVSWEERVAQLLTFKEKNGHCNVTKRDGSLGNWVHNIRKRYKDCKRRDVDPVWRERLHQLDLIGFLWRVKSGPPNQCQATEEFKITGEQLESAEVEAETTEVDSGTAEVEPEAVDVECTFAKYWR